MKKGKYSRKWYLSQHEIYKTLWTEDGGLWSTLGWVRQAGKTQYKIVKRPQHHCNFMNKTGGRSNTAHPPTTITISHFQFILFLSLALYGSYGQRWLLGDTGLIKGLKRALYFSKILFVFILFLSRVHESRLENTGLDLLPILFIKL